MPKYAKGASGMTYETGSKGSLGKDMARNLLGIGATKAPVASVPKVMSQNKGNKLFTKKVR